MPRVKEDLDKKTDLRVIRTKRSIRQAFLQLIQQKPVSKITVTEIARQASINKGTFYLEFMTKLVVSSQTSHELHG